jgi:hypothetical protein
MYSVYIVAHTPYVWVYTTLFRYVHALCVVLQHLHWHDTEAVV